MTNDSEKVNKTYDLLKPAQGSVRDQILSLSLARIASAMEEEGGYGNLGDQFWKGSESHMEELAEKDPEEALEFGIGLTLLRQGPENVERYKRWLRGNGLIMLGFPSIEPRMHQYLESTEGKRLKEALINYMAFETSGMNKKETYHTPEAFSMMIALSLGLGMGEEGMQEELRQFAQERCGDPEVKRVMDFYRQVEDTLPYYQALATRAGWEATS